MRDDGSVLTELGAIGIWIARQRPELKLVPDKPQAEARMTEILEYVEGTIHTADTALFYVERWAPQQDIALPANVQAHYETMLLRPAVQKVRAIWDEC